tara:strand:+ start:561 stop:2102 length:1542 start_codon:yes stop_codon:yes gene_type:complete
MGSLKGKSISKSYQRILQTPSEISNTTLKSVETGSGNATSMSLSTDKAEFLKVGIGTGGAQPDGLLHVLSASAGSVTSSSFANQITIENSGDSGLSILSGATGSGNIYFGDVNDNDVGKIVYDHSDNVMVFGTSGSDKMRLDQQGNLNISGTLSQSDDRYELIENFVQIPTTQTSSVNQETGATTAVTLNSKHGQIIMQSVDLAATDTVEFTLNNNLIVNGSNVVVTLKDGASAIADNAIINVMVNDITAGSCKIRLGTNATDVSGMVYTLLFDIDPHIIANQNLSIAGLDGGSSVMGSDKITRHSDFAGIKLLTGTTNNDRTILVPRTDTELPDSFTPSAWGSVGFGTENQVIFNSSIATGSSVADMAFLAGLKIRSDIFDLGSDNDQAFFFYDTTDTIATLTTNANLHFGYSVSGTDYITNLGIAVTANTVYRLRIIFDEGRRISVFVNNTQYGLVTTATAGGATQSVASTKSLALTNDVNLKPQVGVATRTTAAKNIQVGFIKLSRNLYE